MYCFVFFVAFSSTIESKCKALILWYNPIMNWKAISTLENRNPYFNSFLMSFNCTIGASWQTFLIRRSNLWGATESRNWNVGQLPLRVLFTQLNNSQLLARNLGFNHVLSHHFPIIPGIIPFVFILQECHLKFLGTIPQFTMFFLPKLIMT